MEENKQQLIATQHTSIKKNNVIFKVNQQDLAFTYLSFSYSNKTGKWKCRALHKKRQKLYKFTSNVHLIMVFSDLTKEQEEDEAYINKLLALVKQYKNGDFMVKKFDLYKMYSIFC